MMKNKQETIEKIKQAALEEFYANGYAKASLRTICRRAGVTTGAMYFSFENKEALLRAILEPLVENYEKMLAKSMQIELENPSEGPEIDVYVMQFILKHRKETIIIMEKAQGSCYEGFRERVEKMMEQSFLTYYQSKLKAVPDKGLIKILAKHSDLGSTLGSTLVSTFGCAGFCLASTGLFSTGFSAGLASALGFC